MQKVHYLSSEYNALIDSGTTNNCISQQTFDELRSVQKGCGGNSVESQQQDHLQVVLADGTSTFSSNNTRIKVTMENGIAMQV